MSVAYSVFAIDTSSSLRHCKSHIEMVSQSKEDEPPLVIVITAQKGDSQGIAQNRATFSIPAIDALLRLALSDAPESISSAIVEVLNERLRSRQQSNNSSSKVDSRSGSVRDEMARQHQMSDVMGLSRRELDVLQNLVNGCSNKVIARNLDIAETTVKIHIRRILNKTCSSNRTQAALWATNMLEMRRKT